MTRPALPSHPSVRSATRACALAIVSLASVASSAGAAPTSYSFLLPDHWQATAPRPIATPAVVPSTLAQWWTQFNDPVLVALIDDARAHSPTVKTALSRVAESRARQASARAARWPSLSASTSSSQSRREDRSSGAVNETEGAEAALNASWELDLFGRQGQTITAASADLAQAEADLAAAQAALAAEVASAYVSLRSAEARLRLTESNLLLQTETLQIAEWRVQAGLIDALEARQAKSNLEQTRAELPSLQQEIAEARNQLALLAGRPPGALDAQLPATAQLPRIAPTLAVGIPAETLAQRPDVRSAAHAVDAAAARTRAAQRERLPSLTLSGSIGVEALTSGDLFSPSASVGNLVGSLTAPIFNAGRIRATIAAQSEQEQQALLTYESTVLTALSEVENALTAVQRTQERAHALTTAGDAAREADELARQRYVAGTADYLTVLETQRTRLTLESQEVTARAAVTSAHIQLYRALGGGWENLPR